MNGVNPYAPHPHGPTGQPFTPPTHPRGRRPARRPTRTRLAMTAVLALPLLELAGLILVARALGSLALLTLLLTGAVAGTLVLRRVRTTAARRIAQRRTVITPGTHDEAPAQTALLALAGVLLIIPGFLSDAAGLILLAPPVRRAASTLLGDALLRRLSARTVRIVPGDVIIDGQPYPPR